jgi:hypothetical protein
MSPETTVRFFDFDAAKAGPWVPAAAALLVQSSVDIDVEAVTLIGLAPDALGTVSAGTSETYSTSHAFVRLVSAGAGTASIAASMPVSSGTGGGGGGGGAATIADGADIAQGAKSQTAATNDTGSWSIVQLIKRGLENWTTLLNRVPTLASGRMPVDGSGVTQPVSATSLPLPAGAATAALQEAGNASLTSLDAKAPALVSGRVPVASQDTNGEGAVTYITNTTAVTGLSARQVVCLTDTTFATFTRTNATGSITGVALPAGTLLTGPVTAIALTSGAVAAYA